MIFAVYSGRLGNGHEAVIVEAASEGDARTVARAVLLDGITDWEYRNNPEVRDLLSQHDRYEVEEISLPYLCELS